MTQYDNTNKGTLGKNKNPKSANSPEFTGSLDLKGVPYWVAGWMQEDFMSDDKYISLSINMKDDQDRKGSGRLDANREKVGRQPDFKGFINIDGAKFELAAWTKTGTNAKGPYKFLSLSVNTAAPRVAQRNTNDPHGNSAPPVYNEPPMDFDDDIPF